MYRTVVRPLLFKFDPEWVHNLTIQILRVAGWNTATRKLSSKIINAHSHYISTTNHQKIRVFNKEFPNHVGLAAGYDKDGLAWKGLMTLGFGHIELGTVTPKPQTGNPKPRVFRIPEEEAVINQMGFPGRGADFLAKRLADKEKYSNQVIIGVNIGKNKSTLIEEASKDYLYLLDILRHWRII